MGKICGDGEFWAWNEIVTVWWRMRIRSESSPKSSQFLLVTRHISPKLIKISRQFTRGVEIPLLFVIYTADLERIAGEHGINAHFYADDSQLYMSPNCHSILTIRPPNWWVAWKQLVNGWRLVAWNWIQLRQICCGAWLASVSIKSIGTQWCLAGPQFSLHQQSETSVLS